VEIGDEEQRASLLEPGVHRLALGLGERRIRGLTHAAVARSNHPGILAMLSATWEVASRCGAIDRFQTQRESPPTYRSHPRFLIPDSCLVHRTNQPFAFMLAVTFHEAEALTYVRKSLAVSVQHVI
jgi:hypothetical protein